MWTLQGLQAHFTCHEKVPKYFTSRVLPQCPHKRLKPAFLALSPIPVLASKYQWHFVEGKGRVNG
jgi:hypothetical protein